MINYVDKRNVYSKFGENLSTGPLGKRVKYNFLVNFFLDQQ